MDLRRKPSRLPQIRQEILAVLHRKVAPLKGLRPSALGDHAWLAAIDLDLVRKLGDGALFWVAAGMTELALDASQDLPEWSMDEAPDDAGVMVFERPLPRLNGDPVDCITWARLVDRISLSTWSLGVSGVPRQQDSIVVDRKIGLDHLQPEAKALCSFLHSAWTIMMMPTLSDRKALPHPPSRGHLRKSRPADAVTVITLRQLRHVPSEGPTSGRKYHHRWVVRGHWVNQPCGPGGSRRKLIFREPYIKGPAGAPLLSNDTVWAWRR